MSEFYNNSRLHHISTWGAEFKAYVNSLQSKGNASFPGREKLKDLKSSQSGESSCGSSISSDTANGSAGRQSNRVIMHIDMDCFFVSVGLIDRPDLRGKPVAVTHSRGKGMPVVNQEARQYERMYYENKFGKKEQRKSMDISSLLTSASSASASGESINNNKDSVRNNDGSLGESEMKHKGDTDHAVQNKQSDNVSSNKTLEPSSCSNDNTESLSSTSTSKTSPSSAPGSSRLSSTSTESFSSMAEIASCSYEARKAGIKNGMFMGRAKQLCPDLQMIPYDFDGYKRVSQTLYETVAR